MAGEGRGAPLELTTRLTLRLRWLRPLRRLWSVRLRALPLAAATPSRLARPLEHRFSRLRVLRALRRLAALLLWPPSLHCVHGGRGAVTLAAALAAARLLAALAAPPLVPRPLATLAAPVGLCRPPSGFVGLSRPSELRWRLRLAPVIGAAPPLPRATGALLLPSLPPLPSLTPRPVAAPAIAPTTPPPPPLAALTAIAVAAAATVAPPVARAALPAALPVAAVARAAPPPRILFPLAARGRVGVVPVPPLASALASTSVAARLTSSVPRRLLLVRARLVTRELLSLRVQQRPFSRRPTHLLACLLPCRLRVAVAATVAAIAATVAAVAATVATTVAAAVAVAVPGGAAAAAAPRAP